MNILPPSGSEESIITRVDRMDALLQDIQKVLSEIRDFLERSRAIEQRVENLEKSVARLHSIAMDLGSPGTVSTGSSDRITPLESMVNNLRAMAAEQKTVIDQLVETQEKNIQELRKESRRRESSDEPVIQEIDEIVRRR
jgi:cell division septum initiation protein DivIVA